MNSQEKPKWPTDFPNLTFRLKYPRGEGQSCASWVKEQLPHIRLSDSLYVTATCADVWPPKKTHTGSIVDPLTFEGIANMSLDMARAFFSHHACTPKTLKSFSGRMTRFFSPEVGLLSAYLTELANYFNPTELETIEMSEIDREILKASGWFEPVPEIERSAHMYYKQHRERQFLQALKDAIYDHIDNNTCYMKER
jgi:hypothetical protein